MFSNRAFRIFNKHFAILMVILFLNQIILPFQLMALTSGPSQVEAGSFEPSGTNQMVDLFSGNFVYNLPVMHIPGPDGGYPINLSYHAGVTSEMEASWVGLGWNINPGAINRNLRGLPDDFNGDNIKQELYYKPDRTLNLGLGFAFPMEIFGFDMKKANAGLGVNYSIYYNTYKGIGFKYGLNLSASINESRLSGIGGSAGWNHDSNGDSDANVSLSYDNSIKTHLSKDYNSRHGLTDINFGFQLDKATVNSSLRGGTWAGYGNKYKFRHSAGASYLNHTVVPGTEFPMTGADLSLQFKTGVVFFGTTADLDLEATFSSTKIKENELNYPGYGFLYAQNRLSMKSYSDFNLEKDGAVSRSVPSIPIPYATHDLFNVSAEGLGGTARIQRSDIGIFSDPSISSQTGGGGAGLELNTTGIENKVSVNYKENISEMHSGPWTNHFSEIDEKIGFKSAEENERFEPAYFKMLGEILPSNTPSMDEFNDEPLVINIGKKMEGLKGYITAKPQINNGKEMNDDVKKTNREMRGMNVEYLTRKHLNVMQISKRDGSGNTIEDFADNPFQIGQISVLGTDGKRYEYGLPAINKVSREVMFSTGTNASNKTIITYGSDDDSKNNDKGLQNMYKNTEIGDYAYNYLLTTIYSPDYVDRTGNGPSEDDFGNYVEFIYDKTSDFKWRSPYGTNKAYYFEGQYGNDDDNLANYSYGQKDLFYLSRIETKTHRAEFSTSDREDGLGVSDKDGAKSTSVKLSKLDKIELFAKNGSGSVKLQTVHFEYDYTLCGNTSNPLPNNSEVSVDKDGLDPATTLNPNINQEKGKLSLRKMWFTYENNTIGALSPYEFDYSDFDPTFPDDTDFEKDRWGSYQPDDISFKHSKENPYVNQYNDYNNGTALTNSVGVTREEVASAWNLTQIKFPSGGILNIEYEQDDYLYVQNKSAMHMARIIGTSETSVNDAVSDGQVDVDYRRVYFQLNKPIRVNASTADDELAEYFKFPVANEEVFFKVYMDLKDKPGGGSPWDYVRGYSKITPGSYGFCLDPEYILTDSDIDYYTAAYVDFKSVPIVDDDPGKGETHPFRKAGLQSLKFYRPDLFDSPGNLNNINSASQLLNPVRAFNRIADQFKQLLQGFYNTGIRSGWANSITTSSNDFPSFIRLTTPKQKYGGGHRVKSIILSDNWVEMNTAASGYNDFSYGQTYEYDLEDGTSSGVAEYEPMFGGEEIPFRLPIKYNNEGFVMVEKMFYAEEPINEHLYPAPNVGYSRVVVRPLEYSDPTNDPIPLATSARGFKEYKFYTAKHFPVESEKSKLSPKVYNKSKFIPGFRSSLYNAFGYSQGFVIELNDMHGKPRSIKSYTYSQDEGKSIEVTAEEYIYKTEGVFNENLDNKLDNVVPALKAHENLVSSCEMGKNVEVFASMKENEVFTQSLANLLNVHQLPPTPLPLIIPVLIPFHESAHSLFRSIATNKVITRNGILVKIKSSMEGSITTIEHEVFDFETGMPLLTGRNNSFGDNIYDYRYPAHWAHNRMKGAYDNIGLIVNLTADLGLADNLLYPGDVLMDISDNHGDLYYVEDNDPQNFLMKDNSGTSITSWPADVRLQVIRSGRRNQQALTMAEIRSINNIVEDANIPLFEAITANSYIALGDVPYQDCYGNDFFYAGYFNEDGAGNQKIVFHISEGLMMNQPPDCEIEIHFPNSAEFDMSTLLGFVSESSPSGTPGSACQNCDITIDDDGKVVITNGAGSLSVTGDLISGYEGDCSLRCIPGVLKAYASKFKDNWNYDYANEAISSTEIDNIGDNPFKYGKSGIFRLHEVYEFNTIRKQTNPSTNIAQDGTLDRFVPYDYSTSSNTKWDQSNEITLYSPFGQLRESKDIYMNRYSSKLFGYNNTLETAMATNCRYKELVFDGFEDYGSTTTIDNGNIYLSAGTLSTAVAHTGDRSLKVNGDSYYQISIGGSNDRFDPSANEKYKFSVWVKSSGSSIVPKVVINDCSTTTEFKYADYNQLIEGWQRLSGTFTAPASCSTWTFKLSSNGDAYFDDLRISPFISKMESYVYDADYRRIVAKLDNQNYATYFNYDAQGNMYQTKQETDKGIVTLSTTRKNVFTP